MPLWTDLITPAEATGYVRAALADLEVNNKSLARWLPNEFVSDISVRFYKGRNGFVAEAEFRAFDAEPSIAGGASKQRVTIELPALGQKRVISEYDQLRSANAPDEVLRESALKELRNVARAIADRIERLRGVVLETGKATVTQANFAFDDDFGRSGANNVVAGTLWTDKTVSRLDNLGTWVEAYATANDGVDPGVILMSRRVFRSLTIGNEFRITVGGESRPASRDSVISILEGAGLPPIEIYDRSTASGRVLTDSKLLLLPAAVDPNGGESALGKTYWGRTLTSLEPSYGIAPSEQPGVVVGLNKSDSIPHIAEVESDAIALPVLGNADLSFVARVL